MPKFSHKSILATPSQISCASVCATSKHEHTALESQERSRSAMKLGGLIMLVEIVGGLIANSLAVITDAGHLLTEVVGFAISLLSVWASGWKATPYQSFGYHRLEILGALLSVLLIWLISWLLIDEAIGRIIHKSERVNGILMFAIAAFGFIINFVMVIWLGHHNHTHHHGCAHSDHDHEREEVGASTAENTKKKKKLNINLQGAYLHVMVDMIHPLE